MSLQNIIFKNDGNDFSAYDASVKHLESLGYSVGRMCSPEPTGFKMGDWDIQKWRNLNSDHRKMLDGHIESDDYRNGDVTVIFY